MRFALIAFALGVVALQQQATLPPRDISLYALIPLAVAVLLEFAARRAPSNARRLVGASALAFLVAAAGLAGFGYAGWRAEVRLADELPPAWEGRDIEVVGVIDELPQPVDRGTRFSFSVERSITADAVVPSTLSLAWYSGYARAAAVGATPESVPDLHAGERWHLVVRLKRPHGTVNPHGFDVEAWLLENNLRATGYVRKADTNRRIDAFAGRASDYVARARESIRARILSALERRSYAGVVAALAIGDERAIPATQWQLFNRTGVGHLISISGLHITFFATLVGAAVFWLWKRSQVLTSRLPARKAAAVAGVVAAFGYVLLAGFQVPAQRTLYMLTVAAIGLWLGRPGTASVVWLWALAVVLAWDPWASLTPGFWLSFGAVGLLLYIGVGRIGQAPAWREAMRAQTAITLGLIPLMLVLFQQISVVSPLANAVAIPVVTFIVVPLTLAAIVVPWDLLLVIAHQVFAWVAAFLELLSTLPAAVWQQHAPPAWAAIAGAIGVAWMLAPRGVPGRMLGPVWLVPLFVVVPMAPSAGAFRLDRARRRAGSRGAGANPPACVALRYRAALQRKHRCRQPHHRADAALDRRRQTRCPGGQPPGCRSQRWCDVAARNRSCRIVVLVIAGRSPDPARASGARRIGDSLRGGREVDMDGIEFVILHPVVPNYSNPKLKPNDLSCVLRVANAAGSALLTGDIEARAEADLVRRNGDALRVRRARGSAPRQSVVVDTRIHRRGASGLAVFTPGYRNRFRHPRPEVVERYDAAGIRSYRTDYDGALTFKFGDGRSANRAPSARTTPVTGARHRCAGSCPAGVDRISRRSDRRGPRSRRASGAAWA